MEEDASEEAMVTQDEMAVHQALCEATVQAAELIAEAMKKEKYQIGQGEHGERPGRSGESVEELDPVGLVYLLQILQPLAETHQVLVAVLGEVYGFLGAIDLPAGERAGGELDGVVQVLVRHFLSPPSEVILPGRRSAEYPVPRLGRRD